mmetsp:Transcript_43784/g.113334  ORF Transcript_43784/g.113334 Transcript_43784/m.113334 type:complete len:906 (-) Transcript_43784:373-3090(-)
MPEFDSSSMDSGAPLALTRLGKGGQAKIRTPKSVISWSEASPGTSPALTPGELSFSTPLGYSPDRAHANAPDFRFDSSENPAGGSGPATPTLNTSESPSTAHLFDNANGRSSVPHMLSPHAATETDSQFALPGVSRFLDLHQKTPTPAGGVQTAAAGSPGAGLGACKAQRGTGPVSSCLDEKDLARSLSGVSLKACQSNGQAGISQPQSTPRSSSDKYPWTTLSPFAVSGGLSWGLSPQRSSSVDLGQVSPDDGRSGGAASTPVEDQQRGDPQVPLSVSPLTATFLRNTSRCAAEDAEAMETGVDCPPLLPSSSVDKCLTWPRQALDGVEHLGRHFSFDDQDELPPSADVFEEEPDAGYGFGRPPAGPPRGKKKPGIELPPQQDAPANFRMFNRAQSFSQDDSPDISAPSFRASSMRRHNAGIESIAEEQPKRVPPTPKSPDPSLINASGACNCPATPNRRPKLKAYRLHSFDGGAGASSQTPLRPMMIRRNSLTDSKVLVETKQLARTESVINPEHFKFWDHFEYLRDIGSTKTSEVYAARHHGDKREYAIKKKREKFSNANDRERCLHEIKAVIELPKHRNVVGLYRAWQQDGYFFIQMDLCSGGSLSALLRDATDRQEQLDDELLWRIMSDISGGLDFLHGNSVAHLDIKPDNVYRDSLGNFCVGDFGMAVIRNEWAAEDGDGDYVAPEMLDNHQTPGAPADIYSLGVTMYECATLKKLPRSGEGRLAKNVFVPGRPPEMQELIRMMMAQRPEDRPPAADVLDASRRMCFDACALPMPEFSRSPALPIKRSSSTNIEELQGTFATVSPIKAGAVGNTSRRKSRSEDGYTSPVAMDRRQYNLLSPTLCDSPDLDVGVRDSAPTPIRIFNVSSSIDSPGLQEFDECALEISRDSCEKLDEDEDM